MRRIDSEFDIPQFVASALVRTLASHNFRLPNSARERFAKLPTASFSASNKLFERLLAKMCIGATPMTDFTEAETASVSGGRW
ncbi:hypothetical protein AS149_13330 [Burkholderia cenocepacia]|nr:hypothetical protein AS149_13330 [Burkholderia cenocepacia]